MGEFPAAWLQLREPVDAGARARDLTVTVAGLLAARRPAGAEQPVIDLGAGTGANLRYSAPLLGGAQDWLLVEHDPLLLAAQPDCMRAWAQSSDVRVSGAEPLLVQGTGFQCRLRSTGLDLATQLAQLPVPRAALVSASALLDLVSEHWLRALAERAAAAAAVVWFTLTYDGRIACDPAESEDQRVWDLVNAHQLTDKGFGPALGPRAGVMAERIFTGHGYRTWRAASDWSIGPGQRQLQTALIDGWYRAACEIAGPSLALSGWLARRLVHVEAGRSRLQVGHVDLVGCPG